MSPNTSDRVTAILDSAERHMRRGGFHAVSFRDLAAEAGIKSSSVHYHFPQKADLGRAVVDRYADRLLEALGDADDPSENAEIRLRRLVGTYKAALAEMGLPCLCAVLGAAAQDLPEPVVEAVDAFYGRLLDWARTALADCRAADDRTGQGLADLPAFVVSAVQGAMLLANARGEPAVLDRAADDLMALLA